MKIYDKTGRLLDEITSSSIEGKLDDQIDATKETNALLDIYLPLMVLHLLSLTDEDIDRGDVED